MQCEMAVKSLLSARGLERPSGRPIYWYRLKPVETEALRHALRHEGVLAKNVRPDIWQAAAFLAFAADWWRQTYDGTGWAWEPIFRAVGIGPNRPVSQVYEHVATGLVFWKQPVVLLGEAGEGQRRGWLASVACQGGLPSGVLHREGTRIREFLRRVLMDRRRFNAVDVPTRRLAFDHQGQLGESLRNDVFLELGVAVIDAVSRLLTRGLDPSDPLGDLNRTRPDWRQELPLDMEDQAATDLLTLLVREAAVSPHGRRKAGIGVHTVLRGGEAGWSLERHLSVPCTVFGSTFSHITGGGGGAMPQRFEVYRVISNGGREVVALGTKFGGGTDDPLMTLETGRGTEVVISGPEAMGPVVLELTSSQGILGRGPAPGGGVLLELPWVFVERGDGRGEIELVGQGSVRTRDPEAFIAARFGFAVQPDSGGEAVESGDLLGAERRVFRVRGTVQVVGEDGTVCRVSTGSSEDEYTEYFPARALRSDALGSALYEGVPAIHRLDAAGGHLPDVPVAELEWRPSGLKGWRHDMGRAVGLCDVRHARAGETLFQWQFRIVPGAFKIRVEADPSGQTGRVTLEGLEGASSIRAETTSGGEVRVSRRSKEWIFEASALGEPPTIAMALVDFGEGRSLPVALPFPVRAARFLGRDGHALLDKAMLSLDSLGGTRAQVLAPGQVGDFIVSVSLRCRKREDYLIQTPLDTDERLREVFSGCHELELSVLREKLALLATTTTGLDTYFVLRIEATRGPRINRTVSVCRYEREFSLDKPHGRVSVSGEWEDQRPSGAVEVAPLQVRAISLIKPVSPAEKLPPTDDGGWFFDPASHEAGPWILAGMEGELCRVRPTLWTVTGPVSNPNPGKGGGRLAAVSLIADPGARRRRYGELFAAMATQPEDTESWGLVADTLQVFWSLPPSSHDMFVGLSRQPEALPAVLLSAVNAQEVARAWDYLEQLPFLWNLVPVRAWRDAVKARVRTVHGALMGIPGMDVTSAASELDAEIRSFFAPLRSRLPAMDLIEEISRDAVRVMIPGVPAAAARYLARPREFFMPALAMWKQTVLGGIDTGRLPEWSGIAGLMDRLTVKFAPKPEPWIRASVPDYSVSLLNAPAVSAWMAAAGVTASAEETYRLRELRAYDPAGFDQAYTSHLCLAIPFLRGHFPEVTG